SARPGARRRCRWWRRGRRARRAGSCPSAGTSVVGAGRGRPPAPDDRRRGGRRWGGGRWWGAQYDGGAFGQPFGEGVQGAGGRRRPAVGAGHGVVPVAGRLGEQDGPGLPGAQHRRGGVALLNVGVVADLDPYGVLTEVVDAGQLVALPGGSETLVDNHCCSERGQSAGAPTTG